jgi:lysozyme
MSYQKKSDKLTKLHEGCRLVVYDDATGYLVKPGYTLKGHPTIGWGRAVDRSNGLSGSEADYLFRNDQQRVIEQLTDQRFSFWDDLSEWRKAVLVDMAFNMGIDGLMEFKKMLTALQVSHFDDAANQI